MILCVISMFIYARECIGLRNIVIMMYLNLTMLYPINDFEFELNTRINNTIMLSGKYIVKGSTFFQMRKRHCFSLLIKT